MSKPLWLILGHPQDGDLTQRWLALCGRIENNPLSVLESGMTVNLAIVGLGKIARDQHLPAVRDDASFELIAGVDPVSRIDGVAHFDDLDALLASDFPVDAVSLCTPPQARYALAERALAAGKHVMLEKPPSTGISEIDALAVLAARYGRVLYTAWHSRAAAGVAPAAQWLHRRRIDAVRIDWKEDVRRWHPGQAWIWQPGGLGVFDPGINALSILTALLDTPIFVREAALWVPLNQQTPIIAKLALHSADGTPIDCDFDWTQQGEQSWDIHVATDAGPLLLREGGRRLLLDGVEQGLSGTAEYPHLYAEFAELIKRGEAAVDSRPLRLVLDAMGLATRHVAPAFET